MEISYDRMINWINLYKMNFIQSHCSGHISGHDLFEMIKNIKPKMLFPVHTEHPEMFKKLDIKTCLIEEGKTYKT